MSRRPAIITQADVARALRAAKQAGAEAVEIRTDGVIVVRLSPAISSSPPESAVDDAKVIPL